jgi:hypothetical protein
VHALGDSSDHRALQTVAIHLSWHPPVNNALVLSSTTRWREQPQRWGTLCWPEPLECFWSLPHRKKNLLDTFTM